MIKFTGSGVVHVAERVQTKNPQQLIMKLIVNCRESRWDSELGCEVWKDNYVELKAGGKLSQFILDQIGHGDRVAIMGAVKGREYNERWYTDLWLDSVEIQMTNLADQSDLQNQFPQSDDDLPI